MSAVPHKEEVPMSHIVVLGAGLGGVIMAYEMKDKMLPSDRLTVVNLGSTYSFVPSSPWVAVGWRRPEEITVDLAPIFKRRGIDLKPEGARRVHPAENRIEPTRTDRMSAVPILGDER
jgi:sulfide:quinone oxidoreductase